MSEGESLAVATEPLADLVSRCRKALVAGKPVQAELLAELFARRNPNAARALRRAGQIAMARHDPKVAAVLFRAALTAFSAGGGRQQHPLATDLTSDDVSYFESEAERLQASRRFFDAATDGEGIPRSVHLQGHIERSNGGGGLSDLPIGILASDCEDSSDADDQGVESLEDLVDLEVASDHSGPASDPGYIDGTLESLYTEFDPGSPTRGRASDDYDPTLFEDDLYELDEAPTRGELQLPVGVEGVVPRHRRALQAAADLAADHDLGPDGLRTLTEIFERHGWASSRRAVDRELALGCTVEELRCAYDLRCAWAESDQFSIAAIGHNHHLLAWPLALQIVRSFRGYPDLDEMVEFLDEALIEWKSKHAASREQYQRLDYPAFRDFVSAKVSCSLVTGFCNPILALSSLDPDEDPEVPAGGISARDRRLADLGVSRIAHDSIGDRVGVSEWHPEISARDKAAEARASKRLSRPRRRL